MHPFGSQLLRAFHQSTGWDADNDYSQLTKPTRALLDLHFAPGLHFSLGKLPSQQLANSASLSVLSPPSSILLGQRTLAQLPAYPTLTGSVAYVASSAQAFQRIPSRSTALTNVADWFAVPPPPSSKLARDDLGNNPTACHYLLYGRFHLPTSRLDGLYTQRLSPTIQLLASLVSIPSPSLGGLAIGSGGHQNQEASPVNQLSSNGAGGQSIWNLMLAASHDTGKWAQQYSYSTEDGLFGARVLYNFPATTTTRLRGNGFANYVSHHIAPEQQPSKSLDRKKLVDEDEVMDNVLKGRFSLGGELYFSAQKKSAGVSTGIRFCTIPDPPGVALTQQPTVISATLNPIMGQISTSYGTKIGPNLALATRFDFNLFSFDSDIVFGLEWLQRKKRSRNLRVNESDQLVSDPNQKSLKKHDSMIPSLGANTNNSLINYFWRTISGFEDILSILRARVSPVTGFTLMWEGRWKECLIGIGVQSEFLVSSLLSSPSGCKLPNEPWKIDVQTMGNQSSSHPHHSQLQPPLIKGICFELQYTTDN